MRDEPEDLNATGRQRPPEPRETIRIAAVVLNTVVRDGRVLKEADTLAADGRTVTIFGLDDPSDPASEIIRTSGVRIVRVDAGSATRKRLAQIGRAVVGLTSAAGIALIVIGRATARRRRRSMSMVVTGAGSAFCVGVLATARRLRTGSRAHRPPPTGGQEAHVKDRNGKEPAPEELYALDRPFSNLRVLAHRGILRARRHVGGGVSRRARQRLLLRAVEGFEPHVVHCHDLLTLPVGVAHRRRHGSKVVYDSHEIFEEVSQLTQWRRLRYRVMQHLLSGQVDAFVTVNDSICSLLNDRYPRLPAGVVIKNAVPESTVAVRPSPLRETLELTQEHRILLFQGGFAAHRGLHELVKSAPLLPEAWVVVMMGWGRAEESLRALAAVHGEDRVHFLPGVPQEALRTWTAGADLGAIPYENVCLNHWYCSPNKLWEYPAAGVPVLASPHPELRRTIERHGIGLLLEGPPTAERIAAAVQQVDDAALATMRDACLRFAREDTWERYGLRLTEMYRSLLDGDQSNEMLSRTQRL